MASSDRDAPLSTLARYLQDPEEASRRLPHVVGLFDADDDRVRIAAAWTCCLVAVDDEDSVEYLVRRLGDRLDGDDVSLELTQALDYIAARYPEMVSDVVDEMAADAAVADLPLPPVGNFTRNNYFGRGETREGGGRARVAGGGSDDPHQAYNDDEGPDVAGRSKMDSESDAEQGGVGSATDDEDGATAETDDQETTGGTDDAVIEQTEYVSDIAGRSRFENLHVLASQRRGRYSVDYEALVGRGGDESAVVLRVLRQPDVPDSQFAASAADHLDRWAALPTNSHVVEILDRGEAPHPWFVTLIPGETLADRGRAPPAKALDHARKLATALAHVHQHDVVHAGIDPQNVAYPTEVLDSERREPPLLNNVGLMHAFRHAFDPATCLDPRYAAPEYYDRQQGRIDHQTDIYQLGAVVFRLFTGRAPFQGDLAAVKSDILEAGVPEASAVVSGLPPEVDDLLAKTMATQKFHRYETAEQFRQDLASVEMEGT